MSALRIILNILNYSTVFQIFKSYLDVKNYSQLFGTLVSYLPKSASWTKEWGETYLRLTEASNDYDMDTWEPRCLRSVADRFNITKSSLFRVYRRICGAIANNLSGQYMKYHILK